MLEIAGTKSDSPVMKKLSLAALALPLAFMLASPALAENARKKPAARTTKSHAAAPAPAKPATTKPEAKPQKPPEEPAAQAAPSPNADQPAAKATPAKAEVAPVKPTAPTREEALKRADAFLNASPVLSADFVQLNGDGKRAEGKLSVHRPGRMRFEYALPSTMEVISDGEMVAVRDHKLNTQDLYFIHQTPLKFLLKEKINLENDVKVQNVVSDDSGTTISFEDKSTFGGASHIKLIFDSKTFQLKQWEVIDPQGFETLVTLFNIDRMKTPDPTIFTVRR
jgi:outer membrane lipoprotein-sorting protein